jgi:hypothetical protein
MRPRLLLPAVGLLAAALGRVTPAEAAPTPAPASPVASTAVTVDEQSEFEKGRNAYRAQKYDEADARFLTMLAPQHGTLHDKVLIKQARMYWAATLLALHHEEDASSQIEIILSEDRDYEPDPLAFPTDVVNTFIDTRARLRAKLEEIEREQYRRAAERRAHEEATRREAAAHLKLVERLAGEAEVTRKHSRWVALAPFGIGQFQNGQTDLGVFFLAADSLLLAGEIAAVPVYLVNLSDANATYSVYTQPIAQQYLDRANAARIANLALTGAFAVAYIAGAIQAEVAFVPEVVKIKPRVIPELAPAPAAPTAPPISWSFTGGPLAGANGQGIRGGTVGIVGSF